MYFLYRIKDQKLSAIGGATTLQAAKTLAEEKFAHISLRWTKLSSTRWVEVHNRYAIEEKRIG
jgi:hypothetical protein